MPAEVKGSEVLILAGPPQKKETFFNRHLMQHKGNAICFRDYSVEKVKDSSQDLG